MFTCFSSYQQVVVVSYVIAVVYLYTTSKLKSVGYIVFQYTFL